MGWVLLSSAVLLEVLGTVTLKLSDGFTKLYPSITMALCYILSIIAFAYAIKKLDIGLAYAVWSGLGTLMISTIGVCYFNESVSTIKVMSIGLIVIGVIGLNLQSS